MNEPRILVALDFAEPEQALNLVSRLDPARCRLKVGKELFTRGGPETVRALVAANFDVFLDLKFHDIPNTVAGACRAAAELGVWMLNVHALGGRRMMEAARGALQGFSPRPLLIGVTVLTSLGDEDLRETGLVGTAAENVLRLARLTESCGLDGVVCSPREIDVLRNAVGPTFRLITPGIRPQGADAGDQKRIMTPSEALRRGADYLVIGRPISQAADPLQALAAIEEEVNGAEA